MENAPLISVIIPVYNTKPYLRQCLDSAISQTYGNLDIIVVDDGSTDGSGEICDEYSSNSRVRVYHTSNHGISAARNLGLDHIDEQCEFIAFLDSDDWMEPDYLYTLYNAVVNNDCDLAVCQYLYECVGNSRLIYQIKDGKILEKEYALEELFVSDSMHEVVWNKLYRADLFNKIRFPVGRTYEDVATLYKVLENVERAAVIPAGLIHYRVRKSSLSHNYSLTKLVDSWLAYYERYCYLYEKPYSSAFKTKLILSCLTPIHNMWGRYAKLPGQDKKEARKIIAQMKAFLKIHRKNIMKSVVATKKHKIICVATRFSNPVYMGLMYLADITLKAFRKHEKAY